MTLPVFLSEDLTPSLDALSVGEAATLAGAEGRHAASVRRIGAGEWVDVVDGAGARATCEVSGSDKSSLSLVVRKLVREDAPKPEVILVQALAKGGRDEAAVEICTEIGIDRVIPWASQRAIVKDSRELAAWVVSLTDEAGVAFVCHEEATDSLGAVLAQVQAASANGSLPARIALIVGPEGGIGTEETSQLVDAGARTIGLGDNVLRSSTAGAVALTLIRAAAGKY